MLQYLYLLSREGRVISLFKKLCSLFVFLIPFYDVPRTFREGITLSGILGIVILFLLIIRYMATRDNKIFQYPRAFVFPFLLFFVVYLLSYFYNFYDSNDKAANHVVFYLITFVIYSLVTNTVIKLYGTQWFAKVLSHAVVIVSFIGFYELLLFYTSGMNAYANFLNHGTNVGIFDGIPRLRSTFNEPSHYALFMVCVLPILWYGKRKLAFVLAVISLILTFSSSMYLGVLVASTFYGITMMFRSKIFKRLLPLVIFFSPILVLIGMSSVFRTFISGIKDVSSSDPYRYNAFHAAISRMDDFFFVGLGPASYYDESLLHWGVFNWYLQVMYESGVFALIALVAVIIFTYKNATRSKMVLAPFAVIAFAVQMISMEHYYVPGFWILVAFIFARNTEINGIPVIEKVPHKSGITKLRESNVSA